MAEIFIRFAKMVPKTAENVATVWPFECNCLYFGRPKQMSAIFAENHCSGATNELRFHPPMNPISPRAPRFFFQPPRPGVCREYLRPWDKHGQPRASRGLVSGIPTKGLERGLDHSNS